MQKILILGATGNVGSEIIKQLSKQQTSIVGATRNPQKQSQAVSNVTWREFDPAKSENLSNLFDGITRVFLMSAPGYAEQDKILAPLIEAAKLSNVEKIVMMTAIGVNASDEIPFRKAELQLERSGLNYAIIRPNWFNQNFHTFWMGGILAENKIKVPAGASETSFIDVRDIAACATALLVSDQAENQAYVLTGPESLGYQDAARMISSVSGKEINYEDTDPQAFKQSLIQAQMPEDYASLLVGLFEFVRLGYVSEVSNDVEKIIGRPPIEFMSYAKSVRNVWK